MLTPPALVGHFRVERTAGLLPPLHFSKRIAANGHGVTAVLGLPLFPFRVVATSSSRLELRYLSLPIRDELTLTGDGWSGPGLVWGREFCRVISSGSRARMPRGRSAATGEANGASHERDRASPGPAKGALPRRIACTAPWLRRHDASTRSRAGRSRVGLVWSRLGTWRRSRATRRVRGQTLRYDQDQCHHR